MYILLEGIGGLVLLSAGFNSSVFQSKLTSSILHRLLAASAGTAGFTLLLSALCGALPSSAFGSADIRMSSSSESANLYVSRMQLLPHCQLLSTDVMYYSGSRLERSYTISDTRSLPSSATIVGRELSVPYPGPGVDEIRVYETSDCGMRSPKHEMVASVMISQ